jgi:anti-sigma regulatory factor (Ser/Thr protein kinase)
MNKSAFEINFLDSFKADTSIIPDVIEHVITDLRRAEYPQGEIDEIVLSMDEAVTNAVQETIQKQHNLKTFSEKQRGITVRYRIAPNEFDSTVIDHGKGLDINKMLQIIPDSNSDTYHNQIFDYVKCAEMKRLKVRLNGKEIVLNGIGAGLKIILSFMDIVTIDLIDKKTIIADSVTDFTDGTILNMRRSRRYK